MIKVLIIGAHSYIGQKFRVYVSDMKNIGITTDLVSASDGAWRQVDFSLYDVVLHLSGIVHRKEKKNMEKLYYEINHNLAVEIARKAKENHIKQFIFMSTAAVFGSYNGCITKETLPNPTTYYGKSKLAAEQDIIKLKTEEYHIAIIRPPMIYGEGCKGNYPKLVKLAKYMPFFPKFHNKRSILHIDKLSEHLLLIITNEYSGYTYPQDDKYMDICELVVKLRKKTGKNTYLFSNLNFLIKFFCNKFAIVNKVFGDCYYNIVE